MTHQDALNQIEVPNQVPNSTTGARAGGRRVRAARRRIRSPHPGVVLIPPTGAHVTWRARYVDPDTGRTVKERLDPVALTTAELRRDWAIRKSKTLAKRSMELAAGAAPATGTALENAIQRYYDDHPLLRAATLEAYRNATSKLMAWAARQGIKKGDDLTGSKLLAFRAALIKEPKRTPQKGNQRRGARSETREPRSPHTINRELRATKTVLHYLRKLGLCARITSDDLKDGLERVDVTHEEAEHLKPAQLRELLDAALAHDAEKYAETRAEHRGLLPPGSTPRFEAVAPLVAATLLTGMRFDECVSLEWSEVDLEALDDDGTASGVIHLTSRTKTKRARSVWLEVSPALRELLEVMKPEKAKGNVWGLTKGQARAAGKRLTKKYEAPSTWTWQVLRSTCGTFLTNAAGIYGAASAYRSAKQLGHSVAVAERHYVGVLRGISKECKTLESAMGIEKQMAQIIEAARARMEQAK